MSEEIFTLQLKHSWFDYFKEHKYGSKKEKEIIKSSFLFTSKQNLANYTYCELKQINLSRTT